MKEEEVRRLLDKYEKGVCTPQETKLLEEFLGSFQNEEVIELNHIFQEDKKLEMKIFTNIQHNISKPQTTQVFMPSPGLKWAGIAATFLMMLGLTYILFQKLNAPPKVQTITHNTKAGQRLKLNLSDGTRVVLNAESKISYPEIFKGDIREIVLEGEAFFDVARDIKKPFRVMTQNSYTEVLGTKFNVKDYPKDSLASVSLLEGSIEVNAKEMQSQKPQLLKPGKQWRWNKNKAKGELLTFDPLKVAGWKDNILIFEEEKLLDVIPVLERHFGVKLTLENKQLENCRLNLRSENYTLGKLLQGIMYSGNIKYELKGKKISLYGKGCN